MSTHKALQLMSSGVKENFSNKVQERYDIACIGIHEKLDAIALHFRIASPMISVLVFQIN
ncbi:MAG: hypothetical protein PUP91_13390 [Rhizonema sp. PD37]|nr:hypothetical protein [Rhizonema sp. PD37]